MNNESHYRVYPYRWIVLGVFMFTNLAIQILWISYAPITGLAAAFYGVTDLQIGLLSMSFMIAFIPLSIPSSWAIDTFGFRKSVGIGAVMMALFGVLRGFAGGNYTLVLITTFGLAASQPLLLNSWTTVSAKWFPENQGATAVGLVTLANLVGTAIGMVVTPILVESGTAINRVQLVYGIIAAVSAVLFLIFAREKPKSAPSALATQTRALMLEGLKNAFSSKPFWYTLAVAFVGLGIFNGVSTWVENIIRPRGFSPTTAGTLGAVMLVGGLFGAVIIPAISDKQKKRQRFLYIAIIGAIPGLLGITFAPTLTLLMFSAFVMGFFLVSALPVAMQYAAEITVPTPEGTSNGLIQLFGQGAVVFVYVMEAMKTKSGSFTPSLLLAVLLLILTLLFISQMKDVKLRPEPESLF
ncbi:MAG: MFS transporter [Spirochaetes bacterium]|nr:MAG: MFS transporter [Spirochaetota bacterium]